MSNQGVKRSFFAILLLLPAATAVAAEQAQGMTLFQALMCTVLNHNRDEADRVVAFPRCAHDLVCDYVENKRVVGARAVYTRTPGEPVRKMYAEPIQMSKALAACGTDPEHIVALLGQDEEQCGLYLADERVVDGSETFERTMRPVSTAFSEQHPWVWEAAGDTARFFATHCENFNVEGAIEYALAEYKKDRERTKPIIPLLETPERTLHASVPVLLGLPKELRGVVMEYLRSTVVASSIRLMKPDGEITAMTLKRPLLASERIAYISGYVNFRNNSGNLEYPHLLVNSDPSVLPVHNHPRIQGVMQKALSVQRKSQEDLVAFASMKDALLSNKMVNELGKPVTASDEPFPPGSCMCFHPGRPTFTVPSVTELYINGRLPQEFIDANPGFVEDDAMSLEDCGPKTIILEPKTDEEEKHD